MKILTRITASAFAIAITTVSFAGANANSSQANANYHHHYLQRTVTTVSVVIDEKVGNEVIPLRRLLDLDNRYRGYKVQKVVVRLKPRNRHGRLSLLVDGRVMDRASTRGVNEIVFKPDHREILGHTTRRLQLAMKGKAHIRSISVQIRPTRSLWKAKTSRHDRDYKRQRDHRPIKTRHGNDNNDGFSKHLAIELTRILAEHNRQAH